MPPRKSIQQQEVEKITTKALNLLGENISTDSAENSKVRSGDLRDSQNYRVRPYNVLTVSQNFYGKYNTPKGVSTPSNRSNIKNTPLKNAIKKLTPDAVEVFVKDMVDLLKSPIVTNI